jgi:hypothetical protein
MDNEVQSADPDVWLVEFTNKQMAAFWNIAICYEEDTFDRPNVCSDDPVMMGYRAELESVQQAVSNARPIWE